MSPGYDVEDAVCIRESDSGKAILVRAPVFEEPEWIAKSQITEDSEVYKTGTSGTLIVTEWLAEQKGWL